MENDAKCLIETKKMLGSQITKHQCHHFLASQCPSSRLGGFLRQRIAMSPKLRALSQKKVNHWMLFLQAPLYFQSAFLNCIMEYI